MKISIVSTVYNKEKYLEKHIKSLLEQTYENIEFIFVNDGSTDNSLYILNKFISNKKIKIISQKNGGPNISRQTGFLNSTGNYIYFVDSDDILYDKNSITKVMNILNKHKSIDCLLANMINMYDNKFKVDKCVYGIEISDGLHHISKLYDKVFRNSLCYKIFKKEKVEAKYFIPERNYEDGYLSYRTLNNCENFYYLKEPIYAVNRVGSNLSLTKTFDQNNFDKKYNIIKKLINESYAFQNSLNKLYFKAYLDDLNYSVLLDDKDAFKLLNVILYNKKTEIFKLKNIISYRYFKIFICMKLFENYKKNRKLKKIREKLLNLKKKVGR